MDLMEGFSGVQRLGISLALLGFAGGVAAATASHENPKVALWLVLGGFVSIIVGGLMFALGYPKAPKI